MNRNRPINLDLGTLKYPPMAIASILHRISGLVLFLMLPIMLYFLSLSLNSAESFHELEVLFHSPYYKVILWVFSSALIYHIIAGVRHILGDFGLGEDLATARKTASAVIGLAIILIIFMGFRIW